MNQDILALKKEALEAIDQAQSLDAIKEVFALYLSKKGRVNDLMKAMKNLPNEEKPAYGQAVNEVRDGILEAFKNKQALLEKEGLKAQLKKEAMDITVDGIDFNRGQRHPLMLVTRRLEDIFREMGYQIYEGGEVELDLYNFERANIPANHPARDMQDTFYIDDQVLLRTHTTAIQTRVLESYAPKVPLKMVCPGKVYRKDDDDPTHSHQFMQMEAIVVGENISLADLKGSLEVLVKAMFGQNRTIRFRPSYFQFTEPSIEVDVSCHQCNQEDPHCKLCKGTGWIEVLGAGMVHPKVLAMAGYDPDKVRGFAFGVGIERVAMLKYGIDDIRHFYTNDLRFLKQFKHF